MDDADLANRFKYHRPTDVSLTEQVFPALRGECLTLARRINTVVPDGREKALAITALEEACMWAIAGIARNQEKTD